MTTIDGGCDTEALAALDDDAFKDLAISWVHNEVTADVAEWLVAEGLERLVETLVYVSGTINDQLTLYNGGGYADGNEEWRGRAVALKLRIDRRLAPLRRERAEQRRMRNGGAPPDDRARLKRQLVNLRRAIHAHQHATLADANLEPSPADRALWAAVHDDGSEGG